mgnify:CR=1 FL=1
MRRLTKFLGSALIFIRYRNKKDPFSLFRKMMGKTLLPKIDGSKTVLVAPVRVSPMSNLFEGLMAFFYRMRGYNVSAIMCDQAVTYCENISKEDKNKHLICALCVKEQDRFCKSFKVEKISVKEELGPTKAKEINELVNKRDFTEDKDFIFDGINLKEDILAGTMRYTLKSSVEDDLNLVKEFAKTAFVFSSALKLIQLRKKSGLLFLSHGIYSTWGALTSTSKAIGLSSIVWGRGYVGQGNILFGHNRNYHEDFIHESNSIWEAENLTEEQKEETLSYFTQKTKKTSKRDYVNYYKNINPGTFHIDEFRKGLKNYDRRYGMYSNIPWDGQVFNKTKEFPTTAAFVTLTIEWFKKNCNCCLIIRAHPAELTGHGNKYTETFEQVLYRLYPVLPDNVFFLGADNPITSYDLVKDVDISILYGSTLSLEFAVLGFPVIQTGKFNVSNKGFVFEAETKNLFYQYLKEAKEGTLVMTDNMKKRALLYGYYWVFRRHIFDTTQVLDRLNFKAYKFQDEEEFLGNETLNFVFDRIKNGERIVYPKGI